VNRGKCSSTFPTIVTSSFLKVEIHLHPPTIIVVHPKERASKCTVAPLKGREGFVFWKFPQRGRESLDNYVRLGLGGPLLSPDDADQGLLVLDGTWKFAEKMEREFAGVPIRGLPAWKTAYPRISKLYEDPHEGLATIEALYAAYVQLGRSTASLLDHYHWKEAFLDLNRDRIP
jgi:rRNA small subunit aminocarboxypropyltransferase